MEIDKPTNHGILIEVEGVDGSGKTTFINNFRSELNKTGITNAVFKNHLGMESPFWNSFVKTRSQLDEKGLKISDDASRVLQTAEFLMFTRFVLPELLINNQVVLADRYSIAKRVDSKVSLDGKTGSAELMLDVADDIKKPDIIFYLRVTAETAWKRLAGKVSKDWKENLNILSTAVYYYDHIMAETPNVVVLDSETEQKDIQVIALREFREKYPHLFKP